MEKNEQLEFETSQEDELEEIPTASRTVFTEVSDPRVEGLYNKFKRGKLDVQPKFQRQYVWDIKKASKLIESALLSVPIPTIYISQESDSNEYVIDGQQRLTSFFAFIDGKFPDKKDKEFRLADLKVFTEINGKKYQELSDEQQDKIRDFTIRTVVFKKESNPNLKFEIFERLNTGSVSLNDQELRNCIYRGSFNSLLRELSEYHDFRSLLGLDGPDKRMKDVELVLRFAAFHHRTYLNFKPPMREFLNREAETYRHIQESDAEKLRSAFINACQVVRSMFGEHAFKRFYKGTEDQPDGYWEPKKFNASLYDVLMYSFSSENKNVLYQNLDSIREALLNLMTENEEFINSIELSTSSVQAVRKRFDLWRASLEAIAGVAKKETRCFSRDLKEKLFKFNNTCAICNQRIEEVDDAAVDHIKQYWTGGRTIPENARLTHRYCNWSRPRND